MAALKYRFIGTPLQQPLTWVRTNVLAWRFWRSHPELAGLKHEDRDIAAIIRGHLRPGDNAIDVGCHYGSVLAHMVRASPSGRHLAFEAMADKVAFLRRKFRDVDVYQAAVSDRAGTAAFHVGREDGFSGLVPSLDTPTHEIAVETVTLDDVVPADRPIALVKVDVEGAELRVLRGATALIECCRPLLVLELGPGAYELPGETPGDVHDHLGSLGYELRSVAGYRAGLLPIGRDELQQALTYPFQAFNWVATPREV